MVGLVSIAAPPAHAAGPAAGKHFVIGTDTTYAPFEMRDATSGEMVGIDMDLIRAIAQQQGFTIEIKSLGFDAAVQALTAKQVDAVIAGMTITDERKKSFDFTDPYFQTGLQIAALSSSPVNTLADLKGTTVAVKTGTAGATYADSIKEKYGFTTIAFGQTAQMIDAVKAGQAVAYIEDYPVVAYAISQGLSMKLVGEQVPQGYYGMATLKGANADLVSAFNQALSTFRSDGTYDKVVTKYLGASAATSTDQPAKGKSFVIGTDTTYAPFEMQDSASGEMVGIDMDLIRAIAKQQGFNVEIKSLGFDAAVQALSAKQVDGVIAGMTITDERKAKFDFSSPYFQTGLQIASLAGSPVKTLDDLRGQTLAVKTGTAGATYADSIKGKYGFTTIAFGQTAQMIDAVKAGQAGAYIEDYPVVAYAIKEGLAMQLVGDQVPQGSYGMAVNKGANPELVKAFNIGLDSMKSSGQYQTIVDKYLKAKATEASSLSGLIGQSLPAMLRGMLWTIAVTALALLIAAVLGLIFGSFKVGPIAPLRWIANAYVAVFRGTPLLVQIFFFYFTIPQLTSLKLSAFAAGVMALSLNAGAYMTEIVRGGIQSVDPGQLEAARSLGLPYIRSMHKVVIPQAIKIATPSFINQFIITLKDTSLVAVIGLAELTYATQQLIASNFRSELWLIAAALYFVVITALTWVSNIVDKKVNK